MKPLMLAVLAAYIVAAIHSILAFVNKRRALQRVSDLSVITGFGIHTVTLFVDAALNHRYPLVSMRETLSFLAWTIVAAYGIVLYRYGAQALGIVALPLVASMTFVAIFIRSGPTTALDQFSGAKWLLPLHTTIFVCAYAAFFVVFAASVMYLMQERELKLKTFSAFFHRLPSLSTVNSIASTSTAVGLTMTTLGIATGMVWSSSIYGRLWRNDPKEVFALLTWLLYLSLIVYRSTAHWRGG